MNTNQQKNNGCELPEVKFQQGVTGEGAVFQQPHPHIVFAGRSNAGKSSVINTVAESGVARVSNTPGKTTEINLYMVGSQVYLVDLPGYGYAKLSASRAEKIREQMIWYLAQSEAPIAQLFLVVDIRRGLQDFDQQLLDIAAGENLPTTIIANKVDKCNQSELVANSRTLEEQINNREDIRPDILRFSAHDKTGKTALCELIKSCYAN